MPQQRAAAHSNEYCILAGHVWRADVPCVIVPHWPLVSGLLALQESVNGGGLRDLLPCVIGGPLRLRCVPASLGVSPCLWLRPRAGRKCCVIASGGALRRAMRARPAVGVLTRGYMFAAHSCLNDFGVFWLHSCNPNQIGHETITSGMI